MSFELIYSRLEDVVSLKTGKLDSNAAEPGGRFPFFTCSPLTLEINSFAFDTEAVILAGNNANGVFSTKHFSGKFNAYQRTYVIEPLDQERTSCKYLYYVISDFVGHLKELSVGSATKFLTKTILNDLQIPLPSKSTQDQIVNLLSALDERITLLRETNATLEAIAQALFKSWFVDFDPVRAKAEGRQPEGMEATTAALFPDSFEESELGLVPKGWRIGNVGDLASQKKGSVNPLASPAVLFEHFSLPAFDSGQAPVVELGQKIKSNKTPLPEEAVLLSKLNPHIPRVWLPVLYGPNAVCSTEFLAYSPQGGASKELIYSLLSSESFQLQLCQLVTGTSNSHQRVKPDQVLVVKLPIADKPVFKVFTELVRPLFDRVHAGRLQTQTLTQLRDTLLPRLISGQLRLPEAEHIVEAALA